MTFLAILSGKLSPRHIARSMHECLSNPRSNTSWGTRLEESGTQSMALGIQGRAGKNPGATARARTF